MTRAARTPLAAAVAGLLLITAALFVVGTTIERNSTAEHAESSQTAPVATPTGESVEGHTDGDGAEVGSAESGSAEGTHVETSGTTETPDEHAEESETLAGLETPAAAAGVVIVSILLAAAVYWRPHRLTLAIVAVFTVVAGVLDIVELIHQATEGRAGLAVLVALILLLRILTLGGTARLWKAAGTPT